MAAVYKALSKAPENEHADPEKRNGKVQNKQRVLLLSSRGITYRHRHLLNDLSALLPHARKDAKLDTKSKLYQLNELAELYNCNNVLFFEARKGKDLYMWFSKAPNGPTVKLHVLNLHTMSELHFTGNCLKGSRPILSFSEAFDKVPHMRVIKEIFLHVFGVPKGARKSKPFVDRVMGFTMADGRIWVRVYQIVETEGEVTGSAQVSKRDEKKPGEMGVRLVEIGPRFVLTPIVIQEGSFGGPIIYENKEFVSPNQVRSEVRRKKAGRYGNRIEREKERGLKEGDLGLRSGEGRKERDELDTAILFA